MNSKPVNFGWAVEEPNNYLLDFGALYGFAIGVLLGLCLAFWSFLLNKYDESAITRLLPNLCWCGCYALLLNSINELLIFAVANQIASGFNLPIWLLLIPFVCALSINFTAILWAAIRSIQTDDVLTPRVMRDKLRERARL